ncbi:hypothetical protein [Sandarakinorhabdus sp.]|uniref:hypothetical protein n=1 Tax=Sandarakinorhabdus sp. TaxID=1916663 RepID=UPI003F6F907F
MPTEQQLSAMIEAAVREAVDRTTRELTAKFEDTTAGLKKNRDELLTEKKRKPWQDVLDEADAWMARSDENLAKHRAFMAGGTKEPAPSGHVISREDARDPQRYRAAKEAAARAGKPLVIAGDGAAQQFTTSPVKFLHDEISGTLFANRALVDRVGPVRLKAYAAERSARLVVFKTIDDLPPEMRRRHAEIVAKGDADALLERES